MAVEQLLLPVYPLQSSHVHVPRFKIPYIALVFRSTIESGFLTVFARCRSEAEWETGKASETNE